MDKERVRIELIESCDFAPEDIISDEWGFTIADQIFVSITPDGLGCVSYSVDADVDLPISETLADLIDDILDARNHIKAYENALAANGGQLPVGWCY